VGYAVGGGCPYPRHAEPPTAAEGTWGWDYQGWLPRWVTLGWWHGRYQGGTGAYQTDGPKLLHPADGAAHPLSESVGGRLPRDL
jgi:hypothetical protein